MESRGVDERLVRYLLARASFVGWSLGATALAGAFVAVRDGASLQSSIVIAATTLVAFAVGLWAGYVDPDRDLPHPRDRWLAAGALTAVAAAFGTFAALYEQDLPGVLLRILGLIFGVAVPGYALGLIPPLLLARAEDDLDPDEAHPGPLVFPGLLALGILGGISAGILASGFFLLNALGANSLLMLTALLLLLPLSLPEPRSGSAREQLIFETTSALGALRVTEIAFPGERQAERRLYLNGEEESGELVRSGAPTLAYVAAAEHWLNATTPAGADYLFLGGGAYTLPRRIAERDAAARITVVELDPEVTRIAQRYFGLKPQHNIRSIHGDARAYLDTADGATYDRIYVDVYGGREVLPYSLVTREAAERICERLKPNGLVAMNLIGTLQGEALRQVWSIVRTFGEVFPSLALYTHFAPDYPDPQNVLLAASVQPDRVLPGSAGLFDRWQPESWPEVEGATVFRDVNLPHVYARR